MVNNELIKDDLYMAVNGDWLKTAKIPADKAATGGFYDLATPIRLYASIIKTAVYQEVCTAV